MECVFCKFTNSPTNSIFCSNCGKVISITYNNFFDLFQLKTSFDIDLTTLNSSLLKLLSKLHPDKFINSSEKEKSISADNTSFINAAYRTLKDPILRAEHLFRLRDYSVENAKITDLEFLQESMEWREGGLTCEQAMDIWKKALQKIEHEFNENQYDAALQSYLKLRFIKRFIDEVNSI